MPEAPTTPAASDLTNSSEAEAHLARLHKMSTTAGVTNLDYVAVNLTAIAGVLLGIASVLSFFGALLLVIPAVGIVFAIAALRQIGSSNGTQTGKAMAWIGLLLCVGLGGGAVLMGVMARASVRDDERKVASTILEMGKLVKQGKYKEAYALCDTDLQQRVTQDQFQKIWESAQTPPPRGALGRLESMEWNGVTPYFGSLAGARMCATKAKLKFEHSQDERFDVELREVGDRWLIFQFPALFPQERAPSRHQQPSTKP